MFRLFDEFYVLPIVGYIIIGYLLTAFVELNIDFRLWSILSREILVVAVVVFLIALFTLKIVKVRNGAS